MPDSKPEVEIAEEDELRATLYALLARLLAKPPDQAFLAVLRSFEGDESEIGAALRTLNAAAAASMPDAIEQEYFDLFIGVGEGELVPYGSYYLTGFLHEKPLARLRADMARLGIVRADGVPESEDHIAAVCDMMAGLITGAFGRPADLAAQRRFFDEHIGCWAPRFFENLEAASSAAFYMPVGTLGRLFMAVESQAFEMAA
ncbi:MAG: molecular chaperone TorD family protein [Rhodospirillales bacterium]|nr:molecular chaperone TorD family protein [Rhodospirillales bacterium]